MPFSVTRQVPVLPTVTTFGMQVMLLSVGFLGVVAKETVKTAVWLLPLYLACSTTQPEPPGWTVAANVAFTEPWGTVTLLGTLITGLFVARLTGMAPADLDRVTPQVAFAPTV